MDLEAFSALLQPAGQRLLTEAATGYDGSNALALSRRLRRSYDAALVAAALTQIELRRRARTKFGATADRLYFTSDGLEQASHPAVAGSRADRAGGIASSVLDLCCGIGADLMAFRAAGLTARGIDRDPLAVAVAVANGAALGLPGEVRCADATTVDRSREHLTFVDPARRGAGGRTFDPAAYSPPWSFVEEVLRGPAVAKVAPGIPHALVPAGVEAEWVSVDGAVKEAALWSVGHGGVRRRATLLRSGRPETATLTDADDPGPVGVAPPGRFLYEPDGAVIRASLVTAVAASVSGWLLDPHLAYVSSDRQVATPYARAYGVSEVVPYREKHLRAALRARDVGIVTIKQRGIAGTPEALRSRLALRGSAAATVVLTRTPKGALALLVEPLR